jgi:hypothetical protein
VKLPRESKFQAATVNLLVHTLIATPDLFLRVTGLHHLLVCDYEMVYQEWVICQDSELKEETAAT